MRAIAASPTNSSGSPSASCVRTSYRASRVARERLASLQARITRAQRDRLRTLRERQAGLARHLTALSPLAVLNRGYALVYDDHGALVKDTESVAEGQSIVTRLARGRIHSRVSEIEREIQGS